MIPIKPEEDVGTRWTEYPVCPWCGFSDQDWLDATTMQCDGDDKIATCGECYREFRRELSFECSFSTERVECEPCSKCGNSIEHGHTDDCTEIYWQVVRCAECHEEGGAHYYSCSQRKK